MLRALLTALAAAALTTAALWWLSAPDLGAERRRAGELDGELAPLAEADRQARAFHADRGELELRIAVVSELRRRQDDLAATWEAIEPLLAAPPIQRFTLTPDTAEISVPGGRQAADDLAERLAGIPELGTVEVRRRPEPAEASVYAVVAQRARRPARDAREVDSL